MKNSELYDAAIRRLYGHGTTWDQLDDEQQAEIEAEVDDALEDEDEE